MCLQSYDNGDSQLDSSELLKFIQHNESVVELQSYADQESNKLLRLGGLHAYMSVNEGGGWRSKKTTTTVCIPLRLISVSLPHQLCEHSLLWYCLYR